MPCSQNASTVFSLFFLAAKTLLSLSKIGNAGGICWFKKKNKYHFSNCFNVASLFQFHHKHIEDFILIQNIYNFVRKKTTVFEILTKDRTLVLVFTKTLIKRKIVEQCEFLITINLEFIDVFWYTV